MENQLENFQRRFLLFKKQYEDFVSNKKAEISARFEQQYTSFINSYQIVNKLAEKIEKHEAPEFNVFSIWGIGHLEVITHTPFLEELLNPKGSHGQKDLFLKSFLDEFTNFTEAEKSSEDWKVLREREKVDLRIVNYELMKAVFIENKIYSDAHSGQLSRYYKIFEEQFKCDGEFIYLTIDGDYLNDDGFDETIYPKNKMKLKRLSYRQDITKWLSDIARFIHAAKVKDSLNQYVELIHKENWR
jgi:hypothetical protein